MRRRVLIFGYEIYKPRTDELIAEGETVHVITDRDGPAHLARQVPGIASGEIRNSKLENRNSKFVRLVLRRGLLFFEFRISIFEFRSS